MICPVCEKGRLLPRTETLHVRRNGRILTVHDIEYNVCTYCEEEPVMPEQARRNDEKIDKEDEINRLHRRPV